MVLGLRHIARGIGCSSLAALCLAGCARLSSSRAALTCAPACRPSVRAPHYASTPLPAADEAEAAPGDAAGEPIEPPAAPEPAPADDSTALGNAPVWPSDAPPSPLLTADSARELWQSQGANVSGGTGAAAGTIDASHSTIADSDLASLVAFPELKNLNLRATAVTDNGLAALRLVPQLEFLGLSETAITDAGLTHLEALPRLRFLTLADTGVTDAGLATLARLHSLEGLNLKGTHLTRAGVESLRGELPNCKVVVDDALVAGATLFDADLATSRRLGTPQLVAPGELLTGGAEAWRVPVLDDGTPTERLSRLLEEHFSDPRLLVTLGDLYRERGELNEAIAAYHEALAREPSNDDARYRLGIALAEHGEFGAARRELGAVLEPAAADYNLAVVLLRQGRVGDCREATEAALQSDPAFEPARELLHALARAERAETLPPAATASAPAAVHLLLRALQQGPTVAAPPHWEVAIRPGGVSDGTLTAESAATTEPPLVNQAVLTDEAVPVIEPLTGETR